MLRCKKALTPLKVAGTAKVVFVGSTAASCLSPPAAMKKGFLLSGKKGPSVKVGPAAGDSSSASNQQDDRRSTMKSGFLLDKSKASTSGSNDTCGN